MKLSTRNQLAGRVTEVEPGGIMAEATVDVGAAVDRRRDHGGSAEELELAAGDEVTVLVKATEVVLGK